MRTSSCFTLSFPDCNLKGIVVDVLLLSLLQARTVVHCMFISYYFYESKEEKESMSVMIAKKEKIASSDEHFPLSSFSIIFML